MKPLIVLLVLLLVVLQYKLWLEPGGVPSLMALQKTVQQASDDNAKLKARNQALLAEVQDLKTGHEAIEEKARTELGMVKRDEVFYQIIE